LALVEARTKSPGDDFVSALVKARDVDGDNDALEEVSRRLPALRLAGNTTLEFPASISMRGPQSLRVAW
jgi:cytochrome P450